MSDSLIVYQGAIGAAVTDQIKVGNKPLDLTGATAAFVMRNAFNNTIKVNSAALITNAVAGELAYDWAAEDVDTLGEYKAWWRLDLTGSIIDTEEFEVIVAEHAPGVRTNVGAIYRQARAFMPETWRRLENSEFYGDSLLQQQIDVAKLSLLGYQVTAEDEANLDIRVISYIAKLAVISVIPAGKDYWASMAQTKSAGSPDESVSYPDRIAMLDQLHEQLVKELADDRAIIGDILDIPQVVRASDIPDTSDGTDEGYITPNPHTNFRDYGFPVPGNTTSSRNAVRTSRYWSW